MAHRLKIEDFPVLWYTWKNQKVHTYISYADIENIMGEEMSNLFYLWIGGKTRVASGFRPWDVEVFLNEQANN